MNIILFDTEARKRLFPLTLTKAVADIRTGILTIKERWEKVTGAKVFVLTDSYLQPLYKTIPADNYIFVDACVIPIPGVVATINKLSDAQAIEDENGLIAGRVFIQTLPQICDIRSLFNNISVTDSVKRLMFPAQLFLWNEDMILFDYKLITHKRISNILNETVHITNVTQIFVEDGAHINHSNLNASSGPVYIGKNATVMEGCFIRGPFAMCEGAVLKMGAKIYGATTIGPYCTGGGEIKNSILSGYSNKAHDGYLGDSVIGEWCNIGAGTSNSNLKNTAGEVSTWNYFENNFVKSGNKCGVIMGDYAKTAINTSINTGTVIGACSNIFGKGLTPKVIKNFSWGMEGDKKYEIEKAIKDISNWKKLKNKTLDEKEIMVLKHIFERN